MAATDGLGVCPRCGHALTGVRYWSDLIRPVCLRCNGGTRPRLTGWKEAAEANHRATLHKIATMDEEDEDAEMPWRAVVAQERQTPADLRNETLASSDAVATLRDRLRERRQNERP